MATEIKGTMTRQKVTDFHQRCKNTDCARVFYVDRDCNRKVVICPYCKTRH